MKLTTADINYDDLLAFAELSASLTHRDDSPRRIDELIFGRPKYRRSIGPSLVRCFIDVCKALGVSDIFEIGVMDGRHTRFLLNAGNWDLHSFEPNPHCWASLLPLVESGRVRLLPFAVSASSGFAELRLPVRFLGKDVKPMSGISTLSTHLDDDAVLHELPSQLVATIAGEDYIRKFSKVRPSSLALWVDTEGNGSEVVKGFDDLMSEIPVAIIEVEYGPHFASSPNWNDVVGRLSESRHKLVGRDWQQEGQCNILTVNKDYISRPQISEALRPYLDSMLLCSNL